MGVIVRECGGDDEGEWGVGEGEKTVNCQH